MDCSPQCASCVGSGEITDELRQQVREKYSIRWDNTTPLNRVGMILLTINISIFVMQNMGGPLDGFIDRYCLNTADGWTSGELWRLLTPIFLHVSWWHLALNSLFLWRYCPVLEGLCGSRRFLLLYLLAGVGGNLFSWFGLCLLESGPYGGIGASTSLFGVGAAIIALHYRYRLFGRSEMQTWALYLLGFMLAGFAGMLGNVDNWGHLGGFISGFLIAWFGPRPHGR